MKYFLCLSVPSTLLFLLVHCARNKEKNDADSNFYGPHFTDNNLNNITSIDQFENHSNFKNFEGKLNEEINLFLKTRNSLIISQLSGSACDTYIDACGVCSGKGPSRVDQCGVCGGNNRCISCDNIPGSKKDSCGKCLSPHDDAWNDCWRIAQVLPTVVDAALGSEPEVKLELSKPPSAKIDINCTATQGKHNITMKKINLEENWLSLKVVLPSEIEELKIQCQNTNKSYSWGTQRVTIVNSRGLSISSITPSTVNLGTSTQLQLTVHGISAMLDLYCFIKDNHNSVVYVAPTHLIAGNPMSSTVTCPNMIVPHENANIVGVSYTRQAVPKLMNNNTIKVAVLPNAIKPMQAYVSKDFASLIIDFDQNIGGPTDCLGIFRTSTLSLLGKGVQCQYIANKMTVKLGSGSTIRPRNVIRFSPTLCLRQYGSSSDPAKYSTPQKGYFIKLKQTQNEVPEYKLVGPKQLCLSSSPHIVKVVPISGQQSRYNWSLEVSDISFIDDPTQKQRRNLVIWLGAREIIRPTRIENMNELKINSSLLIPDVIYKLEVIGYNSFGTQGKPAKLYFQLLNSNSQTQSEPSITIISPHEIEINTPLHLEVKVLYGCGEPQKLNNHKFSWKLESLDSSNTLETNGAKTEVPSALLKIPNLYNVTCTLLNGSTVLAKDTVQVLLKGQKLQLNIIPKTTSFSSEHSTELDASKSLSNLDTTLIKVQWFCKLESGQPCLKPKSNQLVSSIYKVEFTKPKLILPAGSLHVGRFYFTLEVYTKDSISTATAEVNITEGNSPMIVLSPAMVSAEFSVFIPAAVSRVRMGCMARWQTLPLMGYQYKSLNNLVGVQFVNKLPNLIKGTLLPNAFMATIGRLLDKDRQTQGLESERTVASESTQDMSLTVPAGFLSSGAKYRVQLSVYCSARDFAQASLDVILQNPPKIRNFQVSPLEGTALKTEFTFATGNPHEMEVLSFGWYSETGSRYFFFNSVYSSTATSSLPCFDKMCLVKTVLKVCSSHQVCSFKNGPVIKTSLPSSLTTQEIKVLSEELTTGFSQGEYEEATTRAVAVLSTTDLMNNRRAYNQLSSAVKETLLQQINQTSFKLEKTPSLRSRAMTLLDCVTKLLPLLQLNDTALSIVVSFRDIIADTSQVLPEKSGKLLSLELVMEPRKFRVKRQHSIPPNTSPETAETVLVWLKTSESAILNFSPEKSAEEKKKLLNNLDMYVAGLCKGLGDFHPIFLESQIVNLSVQKLSVNDNLKTSMSLPSCLDKCKQSNAEIILGKQFGNKYKSTDIIICLSGLQFPKSSLDSIFKLANGLVQLSDVYRMKVLTYSNDEDNPTKDNPLISIGIPIQASTDNLINYEIKCYAIENNKWETNKCEVIKQSDVKITCKCPAYLYYSVFAAPLATNTKSTSTLSTTLGTTNKVTSEERATLPTTEVPSTELIASVPETTDSVLATTGSVQELSTVSPTLSTPLPQPPTSEQLQSVKKVAFRISGRFERTVGNKAIEFSNLLKEQLIQQLRFPREAIQDIYVTQGSILVTLMLKSTEKLSADESIMELTQVLGEGQLRLKDFKNHALDIPRQPLQVLKEPTAHKSGLSPIFLAATTSGVLLFVILYILVVTLVTKRNHNKEALRIAQRTNAHSPPRYLPLPFPHTLDGSKHITGHQGEDLDSGIYDSGGEKRKTEQEN